MKDKEEVGVEQEGEEKSPSMFLHKGYLTSVVLVIIASIMIALIYVGNVKDVLIELEEADLPEFTYSEGILDVDEWENNLEGDSIKIDTGSDLEESKEEVLAVELGKEYLSVVRKGNVLVNLEYASLVRRDLDNESLKEWFREDMDRDIRNSAFGVVVVVLILGVIFSVVLSLLTTYLVKYLMMFRMKYVSVREVYLSTRNTLLFTVPLLVIGVYFGWIWNYYTFVILTILITLVKVDASTALANYVEKIRNKENKENEEE